VSTSRTADLTGRVLGGRYRLLDPIGSGSSAQVYVAHDVHLDRRVAVKVLSAGLAADADFRDQFASEVRIAAAFKHPNIVAVLDWGVDGEVVYLVTELLGGNLRALLDSGYRLTPAQALMIGLECARALEYAHARGMAHRGIKPANVLYDEGGEARLTDFGLARAISDATTTDLIGVSSGSARYVPPERLRGEAVGPPGDIYALAAVLIECVAGAVPLGEETSVGALMEKAHRSLVPPDDLGALRRPLERAGRLDPADRPDATEFAVSLLAAAEDLHAPEPLPLVGAAGLVGAAAAGALATAAARAGFSPSESGSAEPTQPAPSPADEPPVDGSPIDDVPPEPYSAAPVARQPRRWPAIVVSVVIAAALAGGAAYAYFQSQLATNTVPDLIGLQETELNELVGDFGWRIERLEGRKDGTQPGEIIDQDPEAGTELKEGDTLTITVSLGATLAPPPTDLVGLPREQAQQAIVDAGFTVGEVTESFSEDVEAGIVLSVMELPAELPRGTRIDFEVSKGPAPRVIPDDLPGKSFDDAAAILEGMGLTVVRAEEFTTEVPKDTVIESDPGGGAEVPRGGEVTLVVSAGPPWVTIPDVVGLDAEDAADELEALGLVVGDTDGPPNAEVTGTDPPPGTPVTVGTEITLVTNPAPDEDRPADEGDGPPPDPGD
jgi:serine/threonine-protein kinase